MPEPLFRIIASTRQRGTCRSCSAPITWCKTFPNDKAMPLHGDPVALKTEHDTARGLIEFIAASDSHFAQCPQSAKWSKR
jgi:hypothetical protein